MIRQTLFGFCIALASFSYSMQKQKKPECFGPQPKEIIKQKWEKKIQEDVVGYTLEKDKEEKEQDRIRTQH